MHAPLLRARHRRVRLAVGLLAAAVVVAAGVFLVGRAVSTSGSSAVPVVRTRPAEQIAGFGTEEAEGSATPGGMLVVRQRWWEPILLPAGVGAGLAGLDVALWLILRPLDRHLWGPDIGLGRLLALLATAPISLVMLSWRFLRPQAR